MLIKPLGIEIYPHLHISIRMVIRTQGFALAAKMLKYIKVANGPRCLIANQPSSRLKGHNSSRKHYFFSFPVFTFDYITVTLFSFCCFKIFVRETVKTM